MIVLIAGGSGSGKSTLAGKFVGAAVISTDDFYKGKSKMAPMEDGSYNFDEPASVDLQECAEAAKKLAAGKEAEIPDYDMVVSERVGTKKVRPPMNRIVVVEGIFALCEPLRSIGDLKIFIDTPIDLRVARRIRRDTERGRSAIETIKWSLLVEEAYERYVEPTRQYADLILGREGW